MTTSVLNQRVVTATSASPTAALRAGRSITASDFFVLRTPLLPFDALLRFSAGLESCAAAAQKDPAILDQALQRDRVRLRERLREFVARREVREALFLASPSLEDSLEFWLAEPESERAQKVERTLVRYLARMAGRATPFGLFAGCSVGTIADRTQLAVSGLATYQRHTRLDGDYLSALTERLTQDPALQDHLLYRPNSSLYRCTDQFRYAESRLKDRVRSYHLVGIEATPHLDATLTRAARGARPIDLADALVEADADIALEEALSYIRELITHQVLMPELAPRVTGPEPIHALVAQLAQQEQRTSAGSVLSRVRDELSTLDAAGVGVGTQHYRAIAGRLEALPAPVELSRLFQVDLVKPAPTATLGREILEELLRGVELLHRISREEPRDRLTQFTEDFVARYEDREVPLVHVLDEEAGIGFADIAASHADASPLLAGLGFPGRSEEPKVTWGKRQDFLAQKLQDALRAGMQQIVLGPDDLKQLEGTDPPPLPDSFSIVATVLAAKQADLAQGNFQIHLHGISGPSGANLLGRFCHGDEVLARYAEQHVHAEEQLRPGAVFAEVVHLPEGRIGNVVLRPFLRGYEIPYLGCSGAPDDRQIPITDLLVSVKDGRIVLRSERLGCEVIPRLTAAHNFSSPRNLGIYRFLCALQGQGISMGLSLGWGPLAQAPFLPRVVLGKLILSPARWNLSTTQLKSLGEARGVAAQFLAVQKLRAELRLPRWVAVVDGDNRLPLDLDNILSIGTGLQLLKEREQATLTELLTDPEQLCAWGPEGAFVHEIIVPVLRVKEAEHESPPAQRRPSAAQLVADQRRSFAPGSEWLYAKLYTGTATADQVLREVVRPVVDGALTSGAADGWFFIRYGDPDWHIRLRLRGHPRRLTGEVLPALHEAMAPFLEDGRMWRCQLDTYQREVERYGGASGTLLAERIFQADSEAALAIVERLSKEEGADARWRLALCGIDWLLDDLGLDFAGKRAVIQQARQGFGKEFRIDIPFERQLGDKYRKERTRLDALRSVTDLSAEPLAPGLAILQRRSAELAPIVAELRSLMQRQGSSQSLASLAGSYIHMHANRLLRAAARAQELVIYDLLKRLYESQAARRDAISGQREVQLSP